jgi:hypothetical protein
MAEFRPHLAGAVWHGTATRLSDIHIQLFCDDPKSAEIALIDHNVAYEVRTVTGFQGEAVEALSLSSPCRELGEAVGVHLMVYDHDDLRGALKPDARGRTPRGDLAAVRPVPWPPWVAPGWLGGACSLIRRHQVPWRKLGVFGAGRSRPLRVDVW